MHNCCFKLPHNESCVRLLFINAALHFANLIRLHYICWLSTRVIKHFYFASFLWHSVHGNRITLNTSAYLVIIVLRFAIYMLKAVNRVVYFESGVSQILKLNLSRVTAQSDAIYLFLIRYFKFKLRYFENDCYQLSRNIAECIITHI